MKKSIIFIFTLLLISTFAKAQITITPFVQGDMSHFITIAKSDFKTVAKTVRQDITQPKITYSTGIMLNYVFSEKWELKTGVEFQDMGDRYKFNFDVIGITENGQDYDVLEELNHFQFINIPIQLQYNFINDKKSIPFIAFGLGWNRNINNYSTKEYYNNQKLVFEEKINEFDVQKSNFTFNLDGGFRQQLTEKLNLNLFLSGNILLFSTFNSTLFGHRHFNIGLGVGLGYTI